MKQFGLRPEQIQALAEGFGRCIASDRIVVDGMPVGYMYREEAQDDGDSGWCFLAGDESEDYLDQPTNLGVYDVNTVANYDRDIVHFLKDEVGSAYAR